MGYVGVITALSTKVSVCHPDYIYSEILSGKVGGDERKEGRWDGGRKEDRKRRKGGRKREKEGRRGRREGKGRKIIAQSSRAHVPFT